MMVRSVSQMLQLMSRIVQAATNAAGNKIMYSTTENTLRIYFDSLDATANNNICS